MGRSDVQLGHVHLGLRHWLSPHNDSLHGRRRPEHHLVGGVTRCSTKHGVADVEMGKLEYRPGYLQLVRSSAKGLLTHAK